MKKTIKTAVITSTILLGLSTQTIEVQAHGEEKTEIKHTDKTKVVCKNKAKYKLKDCTSLSVYLFKAETKHKLQDLTYYDATEYSKKALKKGAYYEVVYSHDYPIKAFLIKPKTKRQKEILDISYEIVKYEQSTDKAYQVNKMLNKEFKGYTIFY